MKVQIQALALDISADELQRALSSEAKAALKGRKAVVYAIGEEGESRPRVVGEGPALLKWPRAVIRRLADSVSKGTKFFERHGKDNSHDGRKELGEVVQTFTRSVGDKLQAIAVGVLKDDRPELDVCSIEADVMVSGDTVGDVDGVTAVALSSSDVDSPAFPGARRLAVLQCFGPGEPGHKDDAGETGKPGEGDKKMPTFEEVKAFIREHNVFPNQLYSMDDLKQDRTFGPVLVEGESAKKKAAELETKLAENEKKSAAAIRKQEESDAKGRFEKLIPEGATDKQKAFYLRRFDPAKLEKLDDASIKAHLDNEAKEFAEYAKMLGIAAESAASSTEGEESKAESGAADPVEAALKETTGAKA